MFASDTIKSSNERWHDLHELVTHAILNGWQNPLDLKQVSDIHKFGPKDWDFRSIKLEYLQIATEYEYLSSSKYRTAIVSWLNSALGATMFLGSASIQPGLFRSLGLLEYDESSVLHTVERFHERRHGGSTSRFSYPDLMDQARLEIDKPSVIRGQALREGTVRDFLARLYSVDYSVDLRTRVISGLSGDLPQELHQGLADFIALRFEEFPIPWVELQSEKGDDYLRTRIEVPTEVALEVDSASDSERPLLKPVNHLFTPEEWYEEGTFPVLRCQFEIDMTARPELIRDAFSKWLSKRHPASRAGGKKETGWLKDLAAHRLREHGLKPDKAISVVQDRIVKNSGGIDALPRMQDEAKFYTSSNRAKKNLDDDFIRAIRESFY